jgi:hypothetical protein
VGVNENIRVGQQRPIFSSTLSGTSLTLRLNRIMFDTVEIISIHFYFQVSHPVACIIKVIRTAIPSKNFLKMFIHVYLLLLHVSAFVGHLQVEYTMNFGRYCT